MPSSPVASRFPARCVTSAVSQKEEATDEEESEERVLPRKEAGRGGVPLTLPESLPSLTPLSRKTYATRRPKRKGKLPSARRRRLKTPAPSRGLPAVAAVSYLGLRGAPLYRRTATLHSPPLSASRSSCLAASLFLPLSLSLSLLRLRFHSSSAACACNTADRDGKRVCGSLRRSPPRNRAFSVRTLNDLSASLRLFGTFVRIFADFGHDRK